jgi:hypothetical protein
MIDRYLSEAAFRLEKKMIDPAEWPEKVPHELIDMVHEDIEAGYSIGFAHDDELGWCILAAGQGPCIIYCEREDGR